MANKEKQYRDILDTYRHFVREGRIVPEETIVSDLLELARCERVLDRINLNEANGWPLETVERRGGKVYRYNVPDQAWETRDKKREKKVQDRVREIIARYGFGVEFNGDPRGAAIRILLPNGASNNWDGTTWAVVW